MTVFSKQWFIAHQRKLLWLLNTPIVSLWFRYVLRIEVSLPIVGILPHCYICSNPDGSYTADFRTHAKYAKRLYYAFKPFWYLLHAIDLLKIPNLNFGFDTLTSRPDPDPETASVDGSVARQFAVGSGESWASLIGGAGNGSTDAGTPNIIISIRADTVSNQWRGLFRGIFLFDTSALTSSATVSAATLSLHGDAKGDALLITPNIDIYTATPASNTALVAADYSQTGTVSQTGSPISFASFSDTLYNDFAFNTTGLSNISKTGVSKFSAKNANYDVAGVAPAWTSDPGASSMSCDMADEVGTTQDPKLVITYTLGATLGTTILARPIYFK